MPETAFDIYLCSHGRSSLPFAIKSIEQQSVPITTHLFAYKELPDITNHACKTCKKDFFLRVDEDMFLHPRAVEFISYVCKKVVKNEPNVPMIPFMVYDVDSGKPIQSVKLYHTKIAKLHRFNDPGTWSMDNNFIYFLRDMCLHWKMESSVVAIHASIPKAERDKYINNMLSIYPQLHKLKSWPKNESVTSLEHQYNFREHTLNKSNQRGNTEFYRWL